MSRRNWLILGLLLFLVIAGSVVLLFGVPIAFYLGIFNPAPPSSLVTPPEASHNSVMGMGTFDVKNYSLLSSGEITMDMQNAAQAPVNITEIKINGTTVTITSPTLPIVMNPNAELTITGKTSMRGNKGDTFTNTKIEINYSVVGGNKHIDSGIMLGYFGK